MQLKIFRLDFYVRSYVLDEKRGQWDCINDDEAEEEELDDGGIWLG